jgi:sugar phosphate isomerase/epimerase
MTFRFVIGLIMACVASGTGFGATLAVSGRTFTLDGKPFDMWGIRTASASQSQELTDHLLAQLDEYRAHGVNTVDVFFMGSSSGYTDPFSPDGSAIDSEHQQRMERIIRACDQRGMVVIVGIFYQRSDTPRLRDWKAARRAVRTVTDALRPFGNIIVNVANEQNHKTYAGLPWGPVLEPERVLELCGIVKTADPKRIVGVGGYDHRNNEVIGRSPHTDVLLFDTAGGESSPQLHRRFRAAGVDKPMVNVETFGGWTNQFLPQGVFPEHVKQAYRAEVDGVAKTEGLYLHFHNTPWCQPFTSGDRARYDLGGRGTEEDPGIRWYFEQVRRRQRQPRSAAH